MAKKDNEQQRLDFEAQNIIPRDIGEEMKTSYTDYAMSVIAGRALPDVRDGLKPVHRRILYVMKEMGLKHNSPYKKSARVVGECFVENTLVLTDKGLLPIQDIKIGDFVYTQNGLEKVVQLYEMPEKELLKITLENGLSNIVTPSQMFKVITPKLKFEWKQAKDLTEDDYIIVRSVFPEIKNWFPLPSPNGKKLVLDENLGYLLGQLISDGWIEKGYNHGKDYRVGFCSSSEAVINKIKDILYYEFKYNAKIEKKTNISQNYKTVYSIRINNKELNNFIVKTFGLEDVSAETKFIPQQIFCSPKSVIFSFISGLIDGDGSVHSSRNVICYGSVSKQLIEQLLVVLQCFGIFGTIYPSYKEPNNTKILGRKPKSLLPFYYVEFSSINAVSLANLLNLNDEIKKINLKKMSEHKIISSKYDRIPFINRVVFKELSKYHLGGGWYLGCNNEKFRMGIKYPTGCKIRYSKDLEDKELYKTQIENWQIRTKIKKIGSPLKNFIEEIFENNLYFVKIEKVEKVSPQKTYDIQVENSHEFIANGMLSHNCLGKYHPHGDAAVYEAMVRMAQDFSLRYPLVDGQGNFGSIDGDPPAAMRYCVTGDILVFTTKGILPIEKIANGEEVDIDLDVKNYKGDIVKATKFFDSGKQTIIKIKTSCGYELKGSINHPVLCLDRTDEGLPTLKWKILKNITTNDYVIIVRNINLFSQTEPELKTYYPQNPLYEDISLPERMNEDLGFLLGVLTAEGSFHNGQILFNNKNKELYEKVKTIIEKQFKGIKLYERKIKGDCFELSIYHQKVVKFLQNIGLSLEKSDKKTIPFIIFSSTKETIRSFLKGLFEGDGSVVFHKDKRHSGKSIELVYNSKSEELINQLKVILLNFGIITTKPFKDKRNGCLKLIISGVENIKKFKEEIGFWSEKKQNVLLKIDEINSDRLSKTDKIPFLSEYLRKKYKTEFLQKNNFDRYNKLEENFEQIKNILETKEINLIGFLLKQKFFFDKVTSVEVLKEKQKVYSLRVNSHCHSFIAGGFINHNTEVRLNKLAEEMLEDLDKETVDFRPNYDGSLEEPVVLPAKFPNILVNGSSGIAVGMATNIPTHNLSEVCDAIIAVLDNPELTSEDLMQYIKGPDFPTGGIIQGKEGIKEYFTTGRGSFRIRAKAEIEELKGGRHAIIVKEIPYQVNKSELLETIANLASEKKIQDIADLRDESDRDGIRIVIEVKRDGNSNIVLNQLFKHTQMEVSFGVIMLVLVGGKPQVLSMREMIQCYIDHRRDVIYKRTSFELKKAEHRAHIVEGLRIAIENLNKVIKIIRESKDTEQAETNLMEEFKLTKIQAHAILEMKLQQLTSLERSKLEKEYLDLIKTIELLRSILRDPKKIDNIIKEEVKKLKEEYGDERRTKIIARVEELTIEDLIKEEDVVVCISHQGYVKRIPLSTYKSQHRGGKGITGATVKEEDFIEQLIITNTHSYLLWFTNKGRVYWSRVFEVPEGSRVSKGKAAVNLIQLSSMDEKITACVAVDKFDDNSYLIMCTKKGIIKKTKLEEFSNPRKTGIIAINLDKDDALIDVKHTDGKSEVIICTKNGFAIRFKEDTIRPIGRTGKGVVGVRFKSKDDEVVSMEVVKKEDILLTVCENGYGKRTKVDDYRLQSRGGKGVINIKTTQRNGKVVGVKVANPGYEVMIMTEKGMSIRLPVDEISILSRNTQGVRLVKLEEGDKVAAVANIVPEE